MSTSDSPSVGAASGNAAGPADRGRVGEASGAAGGLSLDQLSAAFADMLSTGDDPYAPAPPPEDEEPLAPGIEVELATGSQSGQPDACEITPRSILEALLFVGVRSGESLTSAQIAGLMRGVRPAEIDAFVGELNALYDSRRTPYCIAADGAGYRMRLRDEFSRVRDKFYGRSRRAKLSQASIEVLSLVAYHEPLTAEDVNRLRGTSSGSILSQLVRRQLLRLARTPAHPRGEYSTTDRFLKLFGLESLQDLPRSQDLDAS